MHLLRRRVAEHPQRLAFTFLRDGEEDTESLTYEELDRRARAIASRLQRKGALPGDSVLLLFPPDLEFVAAFLGCLYGGFVAVPAYPPRGGNREDPRPVSIARDARPRWVLTSSKILRRHWPPKASELARAQWIASDKITREVEGSQGAEDAWRQPDLGTQTLAYLQYTSGSTAEPKGVMITHGNLLHNLEMIRHAFGMSERSVVVGWLPLFHDMGLIGNVLETLYAGASAVLMAPMAFLRRPVRWLEAIARYRATTSGGPDFAYELCCRKITPEERARLDLSSWRVAFSGAEPVRAGTLERFAELFRPVGFDSRAFFPCYGLAEATLFVSGGDLGSEPTHLAFAAEALEERRAEPPSNEDKGSARSLVGCGRAWSGQRLAIVDPDSTRELEDGRIGEIWVSGPSVAAGYWRKTEASEQTFAARLAEAPGEDSFLRTGDLGFIAQGQLFVAGRLKDLIIIRGRNHYPQDLELTAAESHAELEPGGGAAFSVESPEGERLIVVHELRRRKLDPERVEAAVDAVRQAIAELHQIQVHVVVCIRPRTLPRTSSGKVRRRACRDAYLAGTLAVVGPARAQEPVATIAVAKDETPREPALDLPHLLARPREERRELLARHLQRRAARVAGLDPSAVDPDQPLVVLGLDSLMAVELSAELEETFGAVVSPTALLAAPNLDHLADQLLSPETKQSREIPSAPAAEHHPLSHGQKALWLLERLHSGTAAWIVAGAATVRGALDARAWFRALERIADRHPALRTTFPTIDGQPRQRVQPALAPELLEEDASTWSEAELQARLEAAAFRPFDLATGPLLRCGLYRRGAGEQVIFLAMHHIVSDLWSVSLLLQQLEALYREEAGGPRASLREPAPSFVDFVAWQERRLAADRGEQLWQYWREQLAGHLPALDLPTDRPRPAVRSTRGASESLHLSPQQTAGPRALARSHQATVYTVTLAALAVLLHRYCDQEELLLGSPTAGRDGRALGGIFGYLVNPVVLRADLSGRPTFAQLLERLRPTIAGAFEHQELPFPLVVEKLQAQRDPSRTPLFEAFFVFEQTRWPRGQDLAAFALGTGGARLELAGLGFESRPLERRAAQFDLMLLAADHRDGTGGRDGAGDGMSLALEYSTDLFDAATIRRLLGHYEVLLCAAAADPDQPVDTLPLLTPAERTQLLVEWSSSPDVAFAEATCLHQLVFHQAARSPEAVAVIDDRGEMTYGQLRNDAFRLARQLRHLGVGPEVPVGLCPGRSRHLIVGVLGILEAGGAFVPLDPTYPVERLEHMLNDAGADLMVTERALETHFPTGPRRFYLEDFYLEDLYLEDPPSAESVDSSPTADEVGVVPDQDPSHLAYVIYTSGSTGRPKGVAIEHRSAARLLAWAHETYSPAELAAVLASTSICFDLSIFEIFAPLSRGGTVVLVENALHFPGSPAAERATLVNTVPSALHELLRSGHLPASVHTINVAGEPLRRELVDRAHAAGAKRVYNLYGPSEDTTYSTWARPPRGTPEEPTIGRPIAGTRAHVLDRRGEPVPAGVPGELFLGGDGLARGYLHRPAQTAERFVPDGHGGEPGQRLYRTGDRVRFLGDGQLEFLGRLDFQVKIRGFRIELGEIENALLRLPPVREAVVVVGRDSIGGQRLLAYVALESSDQNPETAPTDTDLRLALGETLLEYMLPARFVLLPALPRTSNGKVDRRALPEPETGGTSISAHSAPPRTVLERRLAELWCQVLGLEEVGRDQNFFDLGGHSLLLMELHHRLGEVAGRQIPAVDLFRYPTIRDLARHLGAEEEGSTPVGGELRPDARARRGPGEPNDDIAVIGMAGRFPGAANVEELWHNLREGRETIRRFEDEELRAAGVPAHFVDDPTYVKARGVVEGVEDFDAAFFDLSPREAELLDPQHRLLLECAWQALENAGHGPGTGAAVGVFVGIGTSSYLVRNVLPGHGPVDAAGEYQTMLANDKDFVPTRVAYKLNLKGPAVAVQTACSTSLVAVHLACQSLRGGECDLALAGGASVGLPQIAGYFFREGGILSPDGHCRAFADGARGTVPASGAGVVALKRLADARADGDLVYAVIKGSAINNDGAQKVGYTAPGIAGQAEVIAAAQAAAGVAPESISYLEAHGTGTELGDPAEIAALTQAFRGGTERNEFCALGSVKTNLGHLDAAAGVTGLIKTILALHHGEIPPSLHCESTHPSIDFARSPFFVNRKRRPWTASEGPRRAGVSSFGIGGTNAHVVLEEAPSTAPASESRPWQLLPLSARGDGPLARAAEELADHLESDTAPPLADVAYTLQTGRKVFDHRAAVVARDAAEASTRLRSREPGFLDAASGALVDRPVAFLFPGQGAQYPGMARGLYEAEPGFRETVDFCADRLDLGTDLRQILFPPEEGDEAAAERLRQTAVAQPALFVIEYALARLWMDWGIRPRAMIGHSLGEYVAACLAGVFSLEDALDLVATRGRLMQELPPGAMLAVPLPEAELSPLLEPPLALAAVNAPGLCVAAGPADVIEALRRELVAREVAAQSLHTSHAFHSAMMDPVLEPFAAEIARVRLRPPELPFLSNLTGRWATAEEVQRPEYWVRHLRQTVRFADGLGELFQEPGRILLEVGPGRTLVGLARRQTGDARLAAYPSLRHPKGQEEDQAFLLRTLGRLWLQGVEIDWDGFYRRETRRRVPLPTYPFDRQRFWIEPGDGSATGSGSGRLEKGPREDWLYSPVWHRKAPSLVTRGAAEADSGPWLLLLDESGFGDSLARRLEAAGEPVVRVLPGEGYQRLDDSTYAVFPPRRADYDSLLKALGAPPRRVVHTWLTADLGVDTFDATQARGFYSFLALAQALAAGSGSAPISLVVLSRGAQEVTGEEDLEPARATVLGLCQVIPQEAPHLRCRSIDLTLPEPGSVLSQRLLDQLVADLGTDDAEPAVAYRGAHRWVQGFERLEGREGTSGTRIPPGGVVLILGGLGRIGLEIAEHLAESAKTRLALVGRSSFPPRDAWDEPGSDPEITRRIQRLREIEARGGEVWVGQADMAEPEAMGRLLAEVHRRYDRLDVVIHAAGDVGEGSMVPFQDLRPADCERQFRAKVRGLQVLEETLAEIFPEPPGLCLLFSSLAAQLGGLGFAAYSAANRSMDLSALRANRAGQTPWISIGWDAWLFPEDEARAAGLGTEAVDLALEPVEGIAAFHRLIQVAQPGQVLVSTASLQARIARWLSPAHREAELTVHPRPSLQSTYVAPSGELEEKLADVWSRLLGVEPVGVHDNFFELGGNSLIGVQLVAEIKKRFDLQISPTALYETPTLRSLSRWIEGQSQLGDTLRRRQSRGERRRRRHRGKK